MCGYECSPLPPVQRALNKRCSHSKSINALKQMQIYWYLLVELTKKFVEVDIFSFAFLPFDDLPGNKAGNIYTYN